MGAKTEQPSLSERWLQSHGAYTHNQLVLQKEACKIIDKALEDCPMLILGQPFPQIYVDVGHSPFPDVEEARVKFLRKTNAGLTEAGVCTEGNMESSTEVLWIELRDTSVRDWCSIADAVRKGFSRNC